jgi:hypothetical protein
MADPPRLFNTTSGSPPPPPQLCDIKNLKKFPKILAKIVKFALKKYKVLLILFLVPKENTHTLPTGSDGCDFEIFNEANFMV